MAEEYQESEVVFQDSLGFEEVEDDDEERCRGSRNKKQRRPVTAAAMRRESISLPVNIPDDLSRTTSWLRGCLAKEGDSVDDGEMVPPHVITGRRIAGKMMSFSVCTGNGRTLKGRDLSQVRNSILRMTGFLET